MRYIDVVGTQFGYLTPIKREENRCGVVYYTCRCKCGKLKVVSKKNLMSGNIKSCGCYRKGKYYKNIIGKKFGRLLAIKITGNIRYGGQVEWLFKCDCGNNKITTASAVLSGGCKSCGCLVKERMNSDRNPFFIDGKSSKPYPKEFNSSLKNKIRKRDKHICCECGKGQNELLKKNGTKYELHIHHIDFNKENLNHNNLISLCELCHAKTRFNQKRWINYYQNKMYEKNNTHFTD